MGISKWDGEPYDGDRYALVEGHLIQRIGGGFGPAAIPIAATIGKSIIAPAIGSLISSALGSLFSPAPKAPQQAAFPQPKEDQLAESADLDALRLSEQKRAARRGSASRESREDITTTLGGA